MPPKIYLMSFVIKDSQTIEYLESVSVEATTWTTDKERALHFLSEEMIPVTTVILRFPLLEPLKENSTESDKNLRNSIKSWFQQQMLPEEFQNLNV